jgi:hypothetical protein
VEGPHDLYEAVRTSYGFYEAMGGPRDFAQVVGGLPWFRKSRGDL